MGCCKAVGELNKAVVNDDALTPFSPFAHKYTKNNNANKYEITFSVKGIHCAACIQLIEKAAYEFDFITYARVNMSTARLHVIWRGHADNIDILADKIGALGYKLSAFQGDGDGKDEGEKKLLKCIAVSGFGMGNLMLLSVGLWSSSSETMGMSTRDFLHFISAIIALPIVIYAGMPFYKSAYKALRGKRTNMDVPISLAIILASSMSLFEAFNHGEHVYFDSALMLVFFLLIGRYLDLRAKGKARESVANLLDMFNGHATIIKNKEQKVIPIRDLREGMVALVATGEKIPADGVVIKGASEVDTSLITGETIPSPIGKNSAVFAGTINMVKPITIKISSAGENSLLSDIVKLVEVAENNKSKYVRLADYAASLYVPIVHTMGLVTFLLWAFVLDASWQVALLNAVAVLIITCPCALGLAVPIVQVLASSLLMRKGIFVKSGDALERLCFNCLKNGHQAADCPSEPMCDVCDRRHASLLHNYDMARAERKPPDHRQSMTEQSGQTYSVQQYFDPTWQYGPVRGGTWTPYTGSYMQHPPTSMPTAGPGWMYTPVSSTAHSQDARNQAVQVTPPTSA